ncbi:MAG: CPBP family intramembrane glutamic endopeptidase [Balneolaceae bacterium]|nr:CPBP family intramembrane glutamic endopeptidase [Balneolaceae bacterium]
MTEQNGLIAAAGDLLRRGKMGKIGEIVLPFAAAVLIILGMAPLAGENPIWRQMIVWGANLVMLLIVWGGLYARGEDWSHLGLTFSYSTLRTLGYSLLVFIAALAGFMVGSMIMINLTGLPVSADFSGYNYLEGNLPLLLLALAAVFFASSFGEEVIYRGFLITRISELGKNSRLWTRIAVLASSVIFGLIHFEWGMTGMVQTAFMGLALGISFLLVKRNLWILVLAHAYMDAILMIQMYLGAAGQ